LTPAPSPEEIRDRAAAVRARIATAGGDPAQVRLIAVTKVFGVEYLTLAAAAGLTDIGENYAQELMAKHRALGAASVDLTFHFVGGIQRNKIPGLAPLVEWWHGVDRIEVGRAIASRAPGAKQLIEVNVAGVDGRPGCAPRAATGLVEALRAEGVRVEGLMTVAPPDDPSAARRSFRELGRMAADLGLGELSMGMTEDFEIAVGEGATMVRIGRALFGPRPVRE